MKNPCLSKPCRLFFRIHGKKGKGGRRGGGQQQSAAKEAEKAREGVKRKETERASERKRKRKKTWMDGLCFRMDTEGERVSAGNERDAGDNDGGGGVVCSGDSSGDSEGRLLLSPHTAVQQFLDSANRQVLLLQLLLGPGARSVSCIQDSARQCRARERLIV